MKGGERGKKRISKEISIAVRVHFKNQEYTCLGLKNQ